jgi:hypothetical protein
MTKFVVTFEFGSDINSQQAQEWMETIRTSLPEGTAASVKAMPMSISVADLTDAHRGEKIKLYVDKKTGTVEGKLDAVFPSGRQGEARTVVISGTAYTVNYGVAQLSEW